MREIIVLGRAAVDLYSEQIGTPLEEAATFAKYLGGCAANIAVGLARLGMKSAILSRVGKEAMGCFVREAFKKEGVDTSLLQTDKKRLTGLVLLGVDPPDNFPLIFYRENCADMAIDRKKFSKETFEGSRALLITGTHCSTVKMFEMTQAATALAKQAGCRIVLDIDYRPVLWGAASHSEGDSRYAVQPLVAERLKLLLPKCDLVVGTEEEMRIAADRAHIEEAVTALRAATDAVLVRKQGAEGCIVYEKSLGEPIHGKSFPVKVLNVLGAGDAFMSGFLAGWLKERPLQECCTLGNACGAIVVTRHGCSPAMPYWDELQHFLNHPENLERTEQLHAAHKARPKKENVCLLAFDHRTHFQELSRKYHLDKAEVGKFKALIYQALRQISSDYPKMRLGLIIDDEYGVDVMRSAQKEGMLTSRCIEAPNSFPLSFLKGKNPADILRSWPREQLVKVLCYAAEGRERKKQMQKLKELNSASKETGHNLLIEIVDNEKRNSLLRVKEMIAECYKEEIAPAWWKLPPVEDEASWEEIETLIDSNDPYAQGILLLGEARPLEELGPALKKIRKGRQKVKGFAVGRSLWGKIAEQWFQRRISDEVAVSEVAANFTTLIKEWDDDGNACKIAAN